MCRNPGDLSSAVDVDPSTTIGTGSWIPTIAISVRYMTIRQTKTA